jgi:hypothetical protein
MMSKSNQSQSVLARLLAKENIKIQHGNYSTAFFDVKNRILGLPNWKDTSKEVYDLLCGHEVGHALYTPSNAFDSELPVRKDLLNVVEDVRIERMIQETYPGLIRCFQAAYSQLKDKNFFGVNGRDVDSLGLADRINLKAKLGNLIEIEFSSDEEAIRQKIHGAQTWQEVLEATAALEKYLNEAAQKPEPTKPEAADEGQKSPEQSPEQSQDQGDSSESNDESAEKRDSSAQDDSEEASEQDADTDGLDSESTEKQDSADSKPSDDSTDESGAEQDGESDRKSDEKSDTTSEKTEQDENAEPTTPDSQVVETQTAFDTNAKNLLDTSKETLATVFAQAPTDHELDEVVIPYNMIAANRLQNHRYVDARNNPSNADSFSNFMKQTRKAVGLLVKEFELRKAAYQYSRATIAKTGSLNVERLHAYKVSDDLFLSVTKLANCKNHAMMMFVDYSGSMQCVLPHVLKHLINLSVFCRNLGIPFRVYGFTSDNYFTAEGRTPYYLTPEEAGYDRVLVSNLNLIELVSSELSKASFNEAIYALWLRSQGESLAGSAERLGHTPLNETLIVAHKLVSRFKEKYNPDRMISIFLTDGDGQALRTVTGDVMNAKRIKQSSYFYQTGLEFKLNGRYVRAAHHGNTTAALIENLRITTNSEVIGFFIPQNNQILRDKAVKALESAKKISKSAAWALWSAKFEKEYKENDVLAIAGAHGYSNYFIVASGEDLSIDDDEEIEITEDMARSRMARVFTKYSKAKRSNRVFVTKFAEALA